MEVRDQRVARFDWGKQLTASRAHEHRESVLTKGEKGWRTRAGGKREMVLGRGRAGERTELGQGDMPISKFTLLRSLLCLHYPFTDLCTKAPCSKRSAHPQCFSLNSSQSSRVSAQSCERVHIVFPRRETFTKRERKTRENGIGS